MKGRPRTGLLLALACAVSATTRPAPARASCPSYTAGTTDGTHHCGVKAAAGVNPSTDEWKAIFSLIAQGPKKCGSRGPSVPDLISGCGADQKKVPATFPCEILKALGQKESNWKQFCAPSEPASEKGKPAQTLIARDCGYGVSQMTSGLHEGETATFDRDKVASDPVYNLATGAALLAQKWQGSRCIQNRDPGIIEHWYVALWKYNGYSYSNDPANPIFSSSRGVYDPKVGGAAPYQEKVFGIIENGSNNGRLWTPIALAYPRIEEVTGRGATPVPTMECGSPTDCSYTTKRATHRTRCTFTDTAAVPGVTTPNGAAGSSGKTSSKPPTAQDASAPGGEPKPAGETSADAAAGGAASATKGGSASGGGCGGAALGLGVVVALAAVAAVAVVVLRRRRSRAATIRQ